MIKYFIEAFKITNRNIVLLTPFLLFLLLITVYAAVFENVNSILLIIVSLTCLLMWAAFLSGWYYSVRKLIINYYDPESERPKITSLMLKGVGKYFLPILGLIISGIVMMALFVIIIHKIGLGLIGSLSIPFNDIVNAINSNPEALDGLLKSIPNTEINKLAIWMLFCCLCYVVATFLFNFWTPAVFKDTKNIFMALVKSIKFIFKNFWAVIVFFIILEFANLVVGVLSFVANVIPLLSFVFSLFYFYYTVYVVVLRFLFYEKYEAENFSNSGADSIGENAVCDKPCEEDR